MKCCEYCTYIEKEKLSSNVDISPLEKVPSIVNNCTVYVQKLVIKMESASNNFICGILVNTKKCFGIVNEVPQTTF